MSNYKSARPRAIVARDDAGSKIDTPSPQTGKTPSPGSRTRRKSTMSPSKAKHHFNIQKYVDTEAATGATEFLTRVRDILIKPTAIRTYDDVLELKKHIKAMDFVHSEVIPHRELAKDGLSHMRFKDDDGPIWRNLDSMCMHMEMRKYKKSTVICNRGDPAKKYCFVLGGAVEVIEEASLLNENENVNEIDDMIDQIQDDRDLANKVMESFPKDVQEKVLEMSHKVAESGTFDDLDADGNGVLTAEELFPVLAGFSKTSFAVTLDQCKRFAAALDEDGNGEISRDEFSHFVKTMMVMAHIGASREKGPQNSIFRMNTEDSIAFSSEPNSPATPQSPLKRSSSSLSLRRTSSAMMTGTDDNDDVIHEVEEEETEETSVKVIGSVEEITNESQAAKTTSLEGTATSSQGDEALKLQGPLFRLQSKYRKDKNAKRHTNRQRKDILAFGMLFGEIDAEGNYSTTVKAVQNCEIIEIDVSLVDKFLNLDWQAIKDTATDTIPESVLVDGKAGNPPDPWPFTEWVMRLHPSRRKNEHISLVSEYLKQKSEYLEKLDRDERISICKLLEFAEVATKHVVYKQGTEGKAMYILYRGQVELQVRTPQSTAQDEFGFARQEFLEEGEGFGEDSLVAAQSTRRETVVCRDETVNYFLVLPKEKFLNRVVGERAEKIRLRKMTLQRNPALQGMSDVLLTELAQYMEPLNFSAGENPVIATQGEEGKGLYFIARGQCSVIREVSKAHSVSCASANSAMGSSLGSPRSPATPAIHSFTSSKKYHEKIDLGEIGPGATIGSYVFEGMLNNERDHLEEPLIWQEDVRAKAACLLFLVAKEDLCIHISAECRAELSLRLHSGKKFHHELWNAIPEHISSSQIEFSRDWNTVKAGICAKHLDHTKLDTARISDYVTVFGHRLYSQPRAYEIGPGAATYESFASTKKLSRQSMSLNALRALKMQKSAKDSAEKGPTTWFREYTEVEGGGGSAWWKPDAHNMPPQQHKGSMKLLTSVSTGTNRSSTSGSVPGQQQEKFLQLVRTTPFGRHRVRTNKGADTSHQSEPKINMWSKDKSLPSYVRAELPGHLGNVEKPNSDPSDRFSKPRSPPDRDYEDYFKDKRSNVSSPVKFMDAFPTHDMLLSMKHIKPRTGFALMQYVRTTDDTGGILRTSNVAFRLCGVYKTMEEAQSLVNAVFAHTYISNSNAIENNVEFEEFDAWEMLDLTKKCQFLLMLGGEVSHCLSCNWDQESENVFDGSIFPALCKSLDQQYAVATFVPTPTEDADRYATKREGDDFGPTYLENLKFVKSVQGCFNSRFAAQHFASKTPRVKDTPNGSDVCVVPLYEWFSTTEKTILEHRQPADEKAIFISNTISEKQEGAKLSETLEESLHIQREPSQGEIRVQRVNIGSHETSKPISQRFGYSSKRHRKKERKRMTIKEVLQANKEQIAYEDKLRRQILSREGKRVVAEEDLDINGELIKGPTVPNYIKLRVSNRNITNGAEEMENQELFLEKVAKSRADFFVSLKNMKIVKTEKEKARS